MEIWKEIPSAPGFEVSSLGRIRNSAGRIMSQSQRSDGYMQIGLRIAPGIRVWRKTHQFVAEAFLGPKPFPGAQVAHADGVRSHNAETNLRYATCSDNLAGRREHQTDPLGSRNGATSLTEDKVRQIKGLLRTGATHRCIAEQFGVAKSTISHINTGRYWSHV